MFNILKYIILMHEWNNTYEDHQLIDIPVPSSTYYQDLFLDIFQQPAPSKKVGAHHESLESFCQ